MASLVQLLTANRLRDGAVVYWCDGVWVEALAEAQSFGDDATADAALAAAGEFVKARVVVNPYFFEARVDASGIHPMKEREIIRAAGPTVRRDLGKQSAHHVSL